MINPHPDELNPEHPVTAEVREQWHKFCAFLMMKFGVTTVVINSADIQRFTDSDRCNIVVRMSSDYLTLMLMSDEEAKLLVDKEGGLPQ